LEFTSRNDLDDVLLDGLHHGVKGFLITDELLEFDEAELIMYLTPLVMNALTFAVK